MHYSLSDIVPGIHSFRYHAGVFHFISLASVATTTISQDQDVALDKQNEEHNPKKDYPRCLANFFIDQRVLQ